MGIVDAAKERLGSARARLAPVVAATRERVEPAMSAARERLEPVVAAARERLAPVVEPVVERVREAAVEFGEIAVGTAPDAELVADPVGELRDFFGVADTGAYDLAELAELTEPPRESWALSTLEGR